MSKVILDSSALLALIKNEPGSAIIEQLLGHVVMSSINIAEVATILLNANVTLDECQSCILPFVTYVIPFNQDHAFQAAVLRNLTRHKGLSLGDRACLALGIIMHCPIYTADKVWADLDIDGLEVRLFR